MMGFAKIAGGYPSSTKAMVDHLMNVILTQEANRVASYYSTGIVQPDQDAPQTKREVENEKHFNDWIVDGARPDLVRLAEYVMTPDAEMTEGDVEKQLVQDIQRAITAAEGKEELPSAVRNLHGLPDPEPVQKHLAGVSVEELQRRLDSVRDQWAEAVEAADIRAEKREYPDANAPLATVRPDLHPLAAIGLGINPERELTNQQIESLLAGRRSDGELIEGKNYAKERQLPVDPKTNENRWSGPIGSYDFSTSADKSVSVAWAFASPVEQARILNAHTEASREAVGYMAERVGQARMGKGGEAGAEPGHVAWIEFIHHTARRTMFSVKDGEVIATDSANVPGDPDLHTHHLIPNAVFTESGRVGSLDTAAVPGFLMEAGAVYQMRLAHHLREQGFRVELDPKTGSARMPDIPDEVRTLFSKRRMIGELLARQRATERGEEWDALSRDQRDSRINSATQDLKQKVKGGKDDKADLEDWKRQAKELCNWEAPQSFVHKVYTVELSPEMKQRLAYEATLSMLDKTFEQKSVVKHFDLRIAAARGMIAWGGGDLQDVDAVTNQMKTDGIQQYGERTPIIWAAEDGKRYNSVTTGLHEAQEREFIALAKAAADDRSGALPRRLLAKHIERSGLDFTGDHGKAQRAAIEQIGSGGRFAVTIGAAGSGKSAMLKSLVAAWQEQGRDVHGASLAWRAADELVDAGIDRKNVAAIASLIFKVKNGLMELTKNSVVTVDEFGMLGTRQGLELLRLQKEHGFSMVALGDSKQCESPEAGAIIDLARKALGAEQIPEIVTTVRQQSEREKVIAGLFREGRAAEALDMKRSDKTAEMVAGGYDAVVARTAALYRERLVETGKAPTIAAPTNQDAHKISEAVRVQRREMGLLGKDILMVRATDGERNYPMYLAKGDRVRLFKSVGADYGDKKGGAIGRNGSVLRVIDADDKGITLQSKSGKVGKVAWDTLAGKKSNRPMLAYGDAMTIHTAQGVTSNEHILALPSGAQAIDGKSGYSGNTRHRMRSYLLTSDVAEKEAVRKTRPINETREITLNDKWANVARALAYQPEKDTATALLDRVRAARRGGVKEFQKTMPQDIMQAHSQDRGGKSGDIVERRMMERVASLMNRATQQLDRNIGRENIGLSR